MTPPGILVREALDPAALRREVASEARGAVLAFEGVVRAEEAGEPISAIVYEAYEPMAAREIARVVEEACARWPVAVAVRHRLGRVPAGEASLAVACGAARRREAFEALQWTIERIKDQAPIWKTTFEKEPR